VIPEISNIYSTPKLSAEIDKHAYGQVILTIKAPDTTSFVNYVTENSASIVDYLVTKELERTAEWLKKDAYTPQTQIRQMFGISISYPKGLPHDNNKKRFLLGYEQCRRKTAGYCNLPVSLYHRKGFRKGFTHCNSQQDFGRTYQR